MPPASAQSAPPSDAGSAVTPIAPPELEAVPKSGYPASNIIPFNPPELKGIGLPKTETAVSQPSPTTVTPTTPPASPEDGISSLLAPAPAPEAPYNPEDHVTPTQESLTAQSNNPMRLTDEENHAVIQNALGSAPVAAPPPAPPPDPIIQPKPGGFTEPELANVKPPEQAGFTEPELAGKAKPGPYGKDLNQGPEFFQAQESQRLDEAIKPYDSDPDKIAQAFAHHQIDNLKDAQAMILHAQSKQQLDESGGLKTPTDQEAFQADWNKTVQDAKNATNWLGGVLSSWRDAWIHSPGQIAGQLFGTAENIGNIVAPSDQVPGLPEPVNASQAEAEGISAALSPKEAGGTAPVQPKYDTSKTSPENIERSTVTALNRERAERAFVAGVEEGTAEHTEWLENSLSHLIGLTSTAPNAVLKLLGGPEIGYIDPRLQAIMASRGAPIRSDKSYMDMDTHQMASQLFTDRIQAGAHSARGQGYVGQGSQQMLNAFAGRTVDTPEGMAAKGFPIPLKAIQDTASVANLGEGMVSLGLVGRLADAAGINSILNTAVQNTLKGTATGLENVSQRLYEFQMPPLANKVIKGTVSRVAGAVAGHYITQAIGLPHAYGAVLGGLVKIPLVDAGVDLLGLGAGWTSKATSALASHAADALKLAVDDPENLLATRSATKQILTLGVRRAAEGVTPFAPALLGARSPEDVGSLLGMGSSLGMLAHAVPDIASVAQNRVADSAFITDTNWGQSRKPADPPTRYGTNKALDDAHEQAINSLDPATGKPIFSNAQKHLINQMRIQADGMSEIYILNPKQYAAELQRMQDLGWNNDPVMNSRGVAIDPNPGQNQARVLVRADSFDQAFHHELAHPIIARMELGNPKDLSTFFQAYSRTNDPNDFTSDYTQRATLGRLSATYDQLPSETEIKNGTGQYVPGLRGMTKEDMQREMATEALSGLLKGGSIRELTRDPTMLHQTQMAFWRVLDDMGFDPTTTRSNTVLGLRQSIGAARVLEPMVRDTLRRNLGQGAGAPPVIDRPNLRAPQPTGPDLFNQPKPATTGPSTGPAGGPPPAGGAAPEAVQPAAEGTPPAPQPKAQRPGPNVNPVDVIKGLRGAGWSAADAKKAAQTTAGDTWQEVVSNAVDEARAKREAESAAKRPPKSTHADIAKDSLMKEKGFTPEEAERLVPNDTKDAVAAIRNAVKAKQAEEQAKQQPELKPTGQPATEAKAPEEKPITPKAEPSEQPKPPGGIPVPPSQAPSGPFIPTLQPTGPTPPTPQPHAGNLPVPPGANPPTPPTVTPTTPNLSTSVQPIPEPEQQKPQAQTPTPKEAEVEAPETTHGTAAVQKHLREQGVPPGHAQRQVHRAMKGQAPVPMAPHAGAPNIGAFGYPGDASWDHASLRGVGAFPHVSQPGSLIPGYSAGLTKEGAARRGLTHPGQEFIGEDNRRYRWDDTAPSDFDFKGKHHHVSDDYIDVYCYSSDTQILTRRGWLRFPELINTDQVATRNVVTKEFQWRVPTSYINEPYYGSMIHFTSKLIDILVTPDHRMILGRDRTGTEWIISASQASAYSGNKHIGIPSTSIWVGNPLQSMEFHLDSVKRDIISTNSSGYAGVSWNKKRGLWESYIEVHGRRHKLGFYTDISSAISSRRNAEEKHGRSDGFPPNGSKPLEISGDDFCALIGAYISEGSVTPEGIVICQSQQSKGFKPFKELVERIQGFPGYSYDRFHISRKALATYFYQFGHAHEKFIPDEVMNATPHQIRIFLSYYMLGDGYLEGIHPSTFQRIGTSNNCRIVSSTVSQRLSGQLMELWQKIGYSASVVCKKGFPKHFHNINKECPCREYYVVTVRIMGRQGSNSGHSFHAETIDYSGTIHCVTVPNGIVYVRRNGKPSWSGNSPDHAPDPGVSAEQIESNARYMAQFGIGSAGQRGPLIPGQQPRGPISIGEAAVEHATGTQAPKETETPKAAETPAVEPKEAKAEPVTAESIQATEDRIREETEQGARQSDEAYTAAIQKKVLEQVGEQHAANLAPDDQRVRYIAEAGVIAGKYFDPNDAFHQWLLSGTSPQSRFVINAMQDAIKDGRDLWIDYNSAPHKPPGTATAIQREEAQAESTGKARAKGLAEAQQAGKNLVPSYVGVSLGGKGESNSLFYGGASPDKISVNASQIVHRLGPESPYKAGPSGDPVAEEDMRGYLDNINNGWKGDGSAKLKAVKGVTLPHERPGFQPYTFGGDSKIAKAKADFWNLAVSGKGAGLSASEMASPETSSGRARALALENEGYVSGETPPPKGVARAVAQGRAQEIDAAQERRDAALEGQAHKFEVLQAIQKHGGLPTPKRNNQLATSAGGMSYPKGEISDLHSAWKALDKDSKAYLKKNYGITSEKLFTADADHPDKLNARVAQTSDVPFDNPGDLIAAAKDALSEVAKHQIPEVKSAGVREGLTNPLHAKIEAETPGWTRDTLHSGYERLLADNTVDILPSGESASEQIHPGHEAIARALREGGYPPSAIVKAGFLPSETPRELAEAGEQAREQGMLAYASNPDILRPEERLKKNAQLRANLEKQQGKLDTTKPEDDKKWDEMAKQIRDLENEHTQGTENLNRGGALFMPDAKGADLRDLVAMHNTNEEGIAHAVQLGGFPVPSLAITKKSIPFNSFGDYTLIAHPDVVNPEKGAHVFDRDTYTKTQPIIKSTWDKKKAEQIIKDNIIPASTKVDGKRPDYSDLYKFRDSLDREVHSIGNEAYFNDTARIAYLDSIGKLPKIEYEPLVRSNLSRMDGLDEATSALTPDEREKLKHYDSAEPVLQKIRDQVGNTLREKYDPHVDEDFPEHSKEDLIRRAQNQLEWGNVTHYIEQKERGETRMSPDTDQAIRTAVDENGGSKAIQKYLDNLFEPARKETYFEGPRGRKMPYNLENLTEAMTGGPIRASQKTMVEGLGKAAAKNAVRIGSFQEMHNRAEWMLTDPDKEKAYNDETQQHYFKALDPLPFEGSQWDKLDAGTQAIARYKKGPATTTGMQSALYRQGFGKADGYALEAMKAVADRVHNAQTDYFEAKPQRAVKLNEFSAAVVPHDVKPETEQLLRDNGINTIEKYDRSQNNAPELRRQAVERASDQAKAQFMPGERKLASGETTENAKHREFGFENEPFRLTGEEQAAQKPKVVPSPTDEETGQRALFMPAKAIDPDRVTNKVKSDEIHWVPTNELDKRWNTHWNKDLYLGEGGGKNQIGNRYNTAVQRLAGNEKINAPQVAVWDDGTTHFIDGRHTFASMRDAGHTEVPVAMDRESVDNAKETGLIGPNIKATAFMPAEHPHQEYTSADTSINSKKVPAVFSRVPWKEGEKNIDIGGGKYDTATNYLESKGVENHIYDPYNRDPEHNERVYQPEHYDTATVSNVLNVIKEPEARKAALQNAYDTLKPGGRAYVSVYEGNDSGRPAESTKGWQENRPLRSYLDEVRQVFPDASIRNGVIVAEKPELPKTRGPLPGSGPEESSSKPGSAAFMPADAVTTGAHGQNIRETSDYDKGTSGDEMVRYRPQAAFMPFGGVKGKGFGQAEEEGRTFKNPYDLLPRYEISDDKMKWKNPVSDQYESAGPKMTPNKYYKLGDVINHPQLFKDYPELTNVRVAHDTSKESGTASFAKGNDSAPVTSFDHWPSIKLADPADKRTLIHEIQHAIQAHEGLAGGTSLQATSDRMGYQGHPNDAIYDEYQRNAGEIEAREAEGRKLYNEEERRAYPPYSPSNPNYIEPSKAWFMPESHEEAKAEYEKLPLNGHGPLDAYAGHVAYLPADKMPAELRSSIIDTPDRVEKLAHAQRMAREWLADNKPPRLSAASSKDKLPKGKLNWKVEDLGDWIEGKNQRLDLNDPAVRTQMAKAATYDVMKRLSEDGSGLDWYDAIPDAAVKYVADHLDPSINANDENRTIYRLALATTSNGQNVYNNAETAYHAYQHWKDHGELPTDKKDFVGGGVKIKTMISTFKKMNDLMKDPEVGGVLGLKDLLNKPMTVKQMREYGLKISGEAMDYETHAALAMGPKIGSFYSALGKHFEHLVMDMWFKRTMNRMTGDMFGFSPTAFKSQTGELARSIRSGEVDIPPDQKSAILSEIDHVQGQDSMTRGEAMQWTPELQKWSEDTHKEFARAITDPDGTKRSYPKEKDTPTNHLAKNIDENLHLTDDAPTQAERPIYREIMGKVLKNLKKAGIDMHMADAQSSLWFSEQQLYKDAGAANKGSDTSDYLDGAFSLVRHINDPKPDSSIPKVPKKKPRKLPELSGAY